MRLFKFHVKPTFVVAVLLLPLIGLSQKSSRINFTIKEFPSLPARNFAVQQHLRAFPEIKGLGSDVSEWFYWTNYSRNSPRAFWDSVVAPILKIYPQFNTSYAASLKKELYKDNKLPLIKPNKNLMKLSLSHAQDLSRSGILSHSSTNGMPFEQRVFKGGINKCAAENLSLGIPNPVFSLVLLFIDEGIADLGHRKNLLSPYYVEMGIGIARTKGNYELIVQDFACEQGN